MTEQRRLTVDEIMKWKIATELSAGPGLRIAYALREADLEESSYRTHIWSVTPGTDPLRLTRGEKPATSPRWSPDGRYLAFTSARPDGKPGEDGPKSQIWLLPAAGGEAFCLTKAEKGVRSYLWLPDGSGLLYVAEEPEPDAVKARKAKEKKQKLDAVVEHADRRRRQVWRIEAKEGAEATLLFAGDLGLTTIAIAPDGDKLAFVTNLTGLGDDSLKYDLWLYEISTGERRQLTRGVGFVATFQFSPDSSQIAYVGPRDPALSYSRLELFTIPAAGGDPINRCDRNPAFLGDVMDVAYVGEQELVIMACTGCYAHLNRFDLESGAISRITPAAETVVWGSLALTPDRRHAAYLRESATGLPEVMLLDLTDGEPVALTDLNPGLLTEIAWGEQQVITWENEGMAIEGVLALPPGYQGGERLPLLVYVHGGPHSRTPNTLRQYFCFQALAARGYTVLSPNYRGGMGYGHAHAIANRCDLGGGDFRDIMAGVDHLIARGIADPDRMGILGGSYGGYMTNWAIGQTDRFRAAVSLFGIFSLITDYSQSDWPGWELGYLNGFWWENPEPYTRCAPATYVTNMKTPVLIIHGDADNNTNPANSREMYQSLRHLGRTVQYVRYPREGHGVQEPQHKRDEYRRICDWFDHYLLARPLAETGPVAAQGHRLEAGALVRTDAYSGRKPKGRFVELTLVITPGSDPLKLDLGEMRLLAGEGIGAWEVGVAGIPCGTLLVPVGGAVEIGSPATLTLAFDLPAEAPESGWRLVAPPFTAVSLGAQSN